MIKSASSFTFFFGYYVSSIFNQKIFFSIVARAEYSPTQQMIFQISHEKEQLLEIPDVNRLFFLPLNKFMYFISNPVLSFEVKAQYTASSFGFSLSLCDLAVTICRKQCTNVTVHQCIFVIFFLSYLVYFFKGYTC